MATITLYPTSTASPNSWVLAGGASKMAAVATNDGDISYIHSTTSHNIYQAFSVDTSGVLGPTDTILSFILYARCAPNSTSGSGFVLRCSYDIAGGGTRNFASSTLYTPNNFVGVYQLYAAGDGGFSDLFGGNLKIRIDKLAGGRINCTEFYVVIGYTPETPPSTQPPRTMHQFAQRRGWH